jgi:hypothetical protein
MTAVQIKFDDLLKILLNTAKMPSKGGEFAWRGQKKSLSLRTTSCFGKV